jgi:hypothetical protein
MVGIDAKERFVLNMMPMLLSVIETSERDAREKAGGSPKLMINNYVSTVAAVYNVVLVKERQSVNYDLTFYYKSVVMDGLDPVPATLDVSV